jgi:hypothetical protein
MNDAPAGEPYSALRWLHLPMILFVALVTMGSGFGGSSGDWGCGDSPPSCSEECAVEGTYALTFEDMSPLGPGCDALGLSLPEGPLVLARGEDGFVTTKVSDIELGGTFLGDGLTELSLSGFERRASSDGFTVGIEVTLSGNVSKSPKTAEEPLTYTGTYEVVPYERIPPECRVTRRFTATR